MPACSSIMPLDWIAQHLLTLPPRPLLHPPAPHTQESAGPQGLSETALAAAASLADALDAQQAAGLTALRAELEEQQLSFQVGAGGSGGAGGIVLAPPLRLQHQTIPFLAARSPL